MPRHQEDDAGDKSRAERRAALAAEATELLKKDEPIDVFTKEHVGELLGMFHSGALKISDLSTDMVNTLDRHQGDYLDTLPLDKKVRMYCAEDGSVLMDNLLNAPITVEGTAFLKVVLKPNETGVKLGVANARQSTFEERSSRRD